ncbi:hypothetical protein C1703_02340 [Streptomyces sp. Go-475]|nr:hypothetical protein C1703_02340 [Streptomyces sp. Go-475]
MSDAAIVCSHLSFVRPDDTPVFDDLSLTVTTGRTGLVAPNGSDKSTLPDVGEEWDIEERTRARLDRLGLTSLAQGRRLNRRPDRLPRTRRPTAEAPRRVAARRAHQHHRPRPADGTLEETGGPAV